MGWNVTWSKKQFADNRQIDGVVLFSVGIKSFLLTCLYQIRHTLPTVPVYLISDRNPQLSFVEWIDVQSVCGSYSGFSSAYEHLSGNSDIFERLCFYRWFAILEIMRSRNLERIIHLDTDVLVLGDLSALFGVIPSDHIGIGSSAGGSFNPNVTFISGRKVLSDFCDFCLEMYKDRERLEVLREFYRQKVAAGEPGGVCDMYAFGWASGWRGQCASRIATIELNRPEYYGFAVDMSLSEESIADVRQYWKMNGQVKATLRVQDGSVVFESRCGRLFRAMTIHFQGPLKAEMHSNFNAKTIEYCWRYFKLRSLEKAVDWVHPLWRRVVLGSRSLLRKVRALSSENNVKVK